MQASREGGIQHEGNQGAEERDEEQGQDSA